LQYKYPQAKSRLAGLADLLQLGGETRDEKVGYSRGKLLLMCL